jgi:hypothetical protein
MQGQGARWIGEGMPFIAEDSCPFCGRDGLSGLNLISAYKAHFSDSYTALQTEVASIRSDPRPLRGPCVGSPLGVIAFRQLHSNDASGKNCCEGDGDAQRVKQHGARGENGKLDRPIGDRSPMCLERLDDQTA